MFFKAAILLSYISLSIFTMTNVATGASGSEVQQRIEADLASGQPIVVHVVVTLCDNENQSIYPVPPALGNGQNPASNLYWGALYGFRTHLAGRGKFKMLAERDQPESGILRKIVLYKRMRRSGRLCNVFVIGEAWDGGKMKSAVNRFLSYAAGGNQKTESVKIDGKKIDLATGGSSALVVFMGHNGLMDFTLDTVPGPNDNTPPRSSAVLACASKPYFLRVLHRGGSHPLLLTTGLMAPESYTLDAVIHGFVEGASPGKIRDAAAAAYHRYQKCGLPAAQKLFSFEK